jgi:hypothetical protein
MMVQNMPAPTGTLLSNTKQDFNAAMVKNTGSLALPSKSDVSKAAGKVQRTSSGSLIFMLAGSHSVPAVPITTLTATTTTNNKGNAARRAIDLYDELLGDDDSMSSLVDFAGAAPETEATAAVSTTVVEEAQTSAEVTAVNCHKSYSELETVEMLQGICQDHATIKKKTQVLDNCIADQLELATARHAIGSTHGIAVSMSKIARIHGERERVHSALAILERHADDIQSKLNEVHQEATQGLDWANTSTDVGLDLSAHEGYKQELDKILAGIVVVDA